MQDAVTHEAFKTKTSALETHQSRKNALWRKQRFFFLGNLLLVTGELKKEVK